MRERIMFQFTRPRGARLSRARFRARENAFQFTRPRGARRFLPPLLLPSPWFQFTRPRARDKIAEDAQAGAGFNSRAARARRRRSSVRSNYQSFNSRARERDVTKPTFVIAPEFQFTRPRTTRLLRNPPARRTPVSIHAPARGAT